ncbi:hypothetical protein ACWJJH_15385 [Endozoicomonadaceae bacterium StTr2]
MMKYSELIERLDTINWFSNIGQFDSDESKIAIPNLKAWDSSEFPSDLDKNVARIAASMDWLPSSKDQADPINVDALKIALQAVPDGKKLVLDAYKLAMKSLREFDKERLQSGPNDFSEAAKGAALYCVRMAAMESLTDKSGFWTDLIDSYAEGYWPCGLLSDGTVVVY